MLVVVCIYVKIMSNNYLFDIHCHILYGVDDGAKTLEQSDKMLSIAYSQGIRKIILTPHFNKRIWDVDDETVKARYAQLVQLVRDKYQGMELYLGCEVFYHGNTLEELEKGVIPTMAGSRYVLVEFDTSVRYEILSHAVMGIIQNDYIPIIAHAERYECLLKDVDRVYELKGFGALIQVNASGVMGDHGRLEKKFIKNLLKKQQVNFIATDAHRDDKRAPMIKDCASYVTKKYGYDYARKIFSVYPECVVTNTDIEE